jgi:hypothetical protein
MAPNDRRNIPSNIVVALETALQQSDFLSNDERERIMTRLAQLHRRSQDPRIFIAFIGEKKAGKTALVRALTGVPLPVAVRECTAAVCEIQIGMDWHHEVILADGSVSNFEALDDSEQHIRVREAERFEKIAQENAISTKKSEELKLERVEKEEAEAKNQLQLSEMELLKRQNSLIVSKGGMLWFFEFFSWLGWLFSGITRKLLEVKEAEQAVVDQQKILEHSKIELIRKEEASKIIRIDLPERIRQAELMVSMRTGALQEESDTLTQIKQENQQKFQNELHQYIDLRGTPAERISIHTPNAKIPDNVVLLDTPGFNTEIESHRQRTWEAIEEMADICILVSDIRQPMPNSALQLLERVEPFCPYLHVALTKTDLAYQEAEDFGGDPEEEIEEAEEIARHRISRRWESDDHDMKIWTVASIEDDDQVRTRSLFHAFWEEMPKGARKQKSNMLAQEALREMMEMCTMHMSLIEQEIEKFNEVAIDIAFALVSQLEDYERERESLENAIIGHVSQLINDSLEKSHRKWTKILENCDTKMQIRQSWEKIKEEMTKTFPLFANKSTQELTGGILQAGEVLALNYIDRSKFTPLSLQEHFPSMNIEEKDTKKKKRRLSESDQTDNTEKPTNSKYKDDDPNWIWAVGGIAVGGVIGIAINGGLMLPLLLAAGAGSLAKFLLAPLADAKEQLLEQLDEIIKEERESLQTQLEEHRPEINSKILQQSEVKLKDILEEKEVENRDKMNQRLQVVQKVWNYLFETRQDLYK